MLAVQEAASWGWDSPLTLVVLAVGMAATATFVVTQARVPDPLVDVGLLRRRAFLGDVAVNGLVQFGLRAAVLHSSLYLQDLLKLSPLTTGLAVLAMVLPITVAAQLGGRWFDRAGVRPPVLTGLTISTLGMLAWTLALPYLSYPLQVPGMVLTGFGLGLTISPTNTDALSRVGAAERSQASGVLQTVRQLGGTLGVAVVGAVVLGIEHRGTRGSDVQAAADAIAAGFAVSTAAFAVALLAAVRLLARERVAADPAAASEARGLTGPVRGRRGVRRCAAIGLPPGAATLLCVTSVPAATPPASARRQHREARRRAAPVGRGRRGRRSVSCGCSTGTGSGPSRPASCSPPPRTATSPARCCAVRWTVTSCPLAIAEATGAPPIVREAARRRRRRARRGPRVQRRRHPARPPAAGSARRRARRRTGARAAGRPALDHDGAAALVLTGPDLADAHGSLGTPSARRRRRRHRAEPAAPRRHGHRAMPSEGADLLLDLWVPVPSVLVVGAGAIGDALAAQAALLGWTARHVTDLDEARRPPSPASPTPTCSCCSTTTPPSTPCSLDGLRRGRGFFGALGSRHTQAARRERLLAAGLTDRRSRRACTAPSASTSAPAPRPRRRSRSSRRSSPLRAARSGAALAAAEGRIGG